MVVMVMVENRLVLAHAHHVSKGVTGVECFSTLQSNVRPRRLTNCSLDVQIAPFCKVFELNYPDMNSFGF